LIVLSLTAIAGLSVYAYSFKDDEFDYKESDTTKIIDNVAYAYSEKMNGKKFPHYEVEVFGATKEIREKMTEINIVSEIDGLPVTTIQGVRSYFGAYPKPRGIYPNVEKITIPDCITSIGDGAFCGLINIKKIELPKNLKDLGKFAFYSLKNLTEITIPAGVTYIGEGAFCYCSNLEKVTLEGNVRIIDDSAFGGCTKLRYITPCTSLKNIGLFAFNGCKSLKYFYFPETLEEIESGAFKSSGLTTVTIPSKAKTRGYINYDGPFENCINLKTVIYENRKDELFVSGKIFDGCTALETVVFPSSAKCITICPRAFRNCTKLTNLVNTGRIDRVCEAAFANCTSLQSIKFSSMIEIIEKKAFQGCKNLKSVTFTDKSNVPGSYINKINCFDPKTFSGTPVGMKFYVKNATVAKKLKTALKGSGVNNASIYYSASNKLAYKNVK
ncbi:MAG: leucine-rich repeat domain-containing protein, partial [Acutalibacteraceae bacterium]